MYKDWKIEKDKIWNYVPEVPGDCNPFEKEYSEVAQWCNENGKYSIQENGDYFEVALIPEPTEEEKAQLVRDTRDLYLTSYIDPIVTNPLRMSDMSEEEQQEIKSYRSYLLNIPQSEDFPNVEVLTLNEWKQQMALES